MLSNKVSKLRGALEWISNAVNRSKSGLRLSVSAFPLKPTALFELEAKNMSFKAQKTS